MIILREILLCYFETGFLESILTTRQGCTHCSILTSTMGPKMDQNWSFFYRTYAVGGNSLNDVSLRGSPTINFALQIAPICSKGKPRRSEFAKSFTAPSVWLINSKTVLTFEQNLIKTSTREMHTTVTILEVALGLSASKPKSGIKAFDDEI